MSYDERNYEKGITRKKINDKFIYYYIDNGKEVNEKDLERIHKLRIPPAWTNLWISRDANSSIQAVGHDIRGRKQYRYSNVHIEEAEKEKFLRLYQFIKSIPNLNKQFEHDNHLNIYDKNRVIALMLQIIRDYQLRVGKEVYARENRSYGISSLRKNHVKIVPGAIILRFKGKSNQQLHYTIRNPFYVHSIKLLMRLEGDKLFQYVDINSNNGVENIRHITDKDLNEYLQKYMGDIFTTKDFRTYGANLYFINALLHETQLRSPRDRKTIKQNLLNAFKITASKLKHTGAVSKKSYVINFAVELYQNSPELFVKHKSMDPTRFLLGLLQLYKRHVLEV